MASGKSSLPGSGIVLAVALLLLPGCQPVRKLPAAPVADNTYLDLLAGWRLRVVAPVLNDPTQPESLTLAAAGPLSFNVSSTPNLKGFETQTYDLKGTKTRVSIQFNQATLTSGGKTNIEPHRLKNFFPVPPGKFNLRLIYLTRSNNAPHDMALVYARQRSTLTALAAKVAKNPGACDSEPRGCLWIPAGVAVIAEKRQSAPGLNSWEPVQ